MAFSNYVPFRLLRARVLLPVNNIDALVRSVELNSFFSRVRYQVAEPQDVSEHVC